MNKIFTVFTLLFVVPALAETHEVVATATRGSMGASSGFKFFQATTHYRYTLSESFQLGSKISTNFSSADTFSSKSLRFSVGPVFNFGAESLQDSYFLDAQVGIGISKYNDAGDWDGSRSLSLNFGKRFALAESVSYNPSLYWTRTWIGSTSFPASFGIEFLAIAVHF
jgi:hypothetical protein